MHRQHTLDEGSQDLAAGLEERVANHDLEELFETSPPALDDVVRESVGEDLAGKRGDGDAGALTLEDVAEVLEVAVSPADARGAQFEGWDVGSAHDLVVGVHVTAGAVGSRVAHLERLGSLVSRGVHYGKPRKLNFVSQERGKSTRRCSPSGTEEEKVRKVSVARRGNYTGD